MALFFQFRNHKELATYQLLAFMERVNIANGKDKHLKMFHAL